MMLNFCLGKTLTATVLFEACICCGTTVAYQDKRRIALCPDCVGRKDWVGITGIEPAEYCQ